MLLCSNINPLSRGLPFIFVHSSQLFFKIVNDYNHYIKIFYAYTKNITVNINHENHCKNSYEINLNLCNKCI